MQQLKTTAYEFRGADARLPSRAADSSERLQGHVKLGPGQPETESKAALRLRLRQRAEPGIQPECLPVPRGPNRVSRAPLRGDPRTVDGAALPVKDWELCQKVVGTKERKGAREKIQGEKETTELKRAPLISKEFPQRLTSFTKSISNSCEDTQMFDWI